MVSYDIKRDSQESPEAFFKIRQAFRESTPPPSCSSFALWLTSAMIKSTLKKFMDPDSHVDQHRNLIICSLCYYPHFLKISSTSCPELPQANYRQVSHCWRLIM